MADTKTIASAGTATSDAWTAPSTAVEGYLHILVDNQGTPASGDIAQCKPILSAGDPDNGGTPSYETQENKNPLPIDTYLKDPAEKIMRIPPLNGKLFCQNDGASSIVVSHVIEWLLADGTKSTTQGAWT